MWRRLRRRTMAPRRPAVFESQYALALVTVLVVLASIGFVAWVLFSN